MGILRGTSDTIEVKAKAAISEDLGKVRNLTFKVTFQRRGREAVQEIIANLNDSDSDVTVGSILRDDLVGWRELEGEGGEVDYTADNLDAMIDHPEYCKALFDAWGSAQMGRTIANTKN